jgi:hypothetical protein
MTPREKAVLLVASMSFSKAKVADYVTGEMVDIPGNIYAKQCALIAVDEITKAIDFDWMEVQNLDSEHRYWEKVKQEIKKL